ncbi:hypothetical protein AAVH_40656, partial [Aphelenchoides avenae]
VALTALAEHDKELKDILLAMAGDLVTIDNRLSAIEDKIYKRKKNKDEKDDAENSTENPPPPKP